MDLFHEFQHGTFENMFDFEKLDVYQKAKLLNHHIFKWMRYKHLNKRVVDQLNRASLSILLNIAEGSGRHTMADSKRFYVISRGSVFETVAILDYLQTIGLLEDAVYQKLYGLSEDISKMLLSMIRYHTN